MSRPFERLSTFCRDFGGFVGGSIASGLWCRVVVVVILVVILVVVICIISLVADGSQLCCFSATLVIYLDIRMMVYVL